MQRVALGLLRQTVDEALCKSGLRPDYAKLVASAVHDAERDGCASHGLFRVPGYCRALQTGFVDGTAVPTMESKHGSALLVNGNGGLAIPALDFAFPHAMAAARANGIALVGFRNTHHFHALWWEAERYAQEGLVCLTMVNTAAFVAHAPGGKQPVYGTNPIAFGFPRGEGKEPVIWDMATSGMARGEIQLHHREGLKLPEGMGIDRTGTGTQDPAAVLDGGAQLPFAGHKGSAIALMVELMAAGLTGSPFADEQCVPDGSPPGGVPTRQGECSIVIDPSAFGWKPDATEAYLRRLTDSGSSVRLGGDRRRQKREVSMSSGSVNLNRDLWKQVTLLATGSARL